MKHVALIAMLAVLVPACYTTTGMIAGGTAAVSTALAVTTVASAANCSGEECNGGRLGGALVFGGIAAIAGIVALVAEHNYHSHAPSQAATGTEYQRVGSRGTALLGSSTLDPDIGTLRPLLIK